MLESSLGRTYSTMNDNAKMLEHHRNALALRRRVFGDADPMTANSHNNVAAAYHALGRFHDALAEHQVALAMREKALGHDHPSVAQSMSNIGNQYTSSATLPPAFAIPMPRSRSRGYRCR